MTGITAIGAYLPRARLSRAAIADAMGWLTPGLPRKGSRTLGFWDEDATTMGVAAARTCLAQPGQVHAPASLDFCTLTPPFAERQNASILHAALRRSDRARHALFGTRKVHCELLEQPLQLTAKSRAFPLAGLAERIKRLLRGCFGGRAHRARCPRVF